MTTTAMGFDSNGHAAATAVTTAGQPAAGAGGLVQKLQAFEGFLKRAGHVAGLVLSDVVRFVMPVVQAAVLVDPAAAAAMQAFTTSLQLVQATVIATQQRWAAEGSAANDKKLADVLTVVEQPIVQMFQQVGLQVDTAYVVNLVNGVVAILNAQPAGALGTKLGTL